MVIFVLKTINFRLIFTITRKIKIRMIENDFSFDSAHCASFIKMEAKLRGWVVYIFLVGKKTLGPHITDQLPKCNYFREYFTTPLPIRIPVYALVLTELNYVIYFSQLQLLFATTMRKYFSVCSFGL